MQLTKLEQLVQLLLFGARADPEKLQKVVYSIHAPEHYEASDNGDHRLDNVQLCVRQLAACCISSRLLLNRSSALITWCGCLVSALILTQVTTDNLALTSDGAKYTSVAEGEDADRDRVLPQEEDEPECLWNNYWTQLTSRFINT